MGLATYMRRRYDLYICPIAGAALALHGALAIAGLPMASPAARALSVGLGLALLFIPGYSLGLAANLDRLGAAVLAALSIAFSTALLTIVGTAIWLAGAQFSAPLSETLLAGLTLGASIVIFWRRRRDYEHAWHRPKRVAALGTFAMVLVVAGLLFSDLLPVSPATRYTEFSIARQPSGAVISIVNQEGARETYQVVMESSAGRRQLASVELAAGAQWSSSLPASAEHKQPVRLLLYRAGDSAPYRTLWLDT